MSRLSLCCAQRKSHASPSRTQTLVLQNSHWGNSGMYEACERDIQLGQDQVCGLDAATLLPVFMSHDHVAYISHPWHTWQRRNFHYEPAYILQPVNSIVVRYHHIISLYGYPPRTNSPADALLYSVQSLLINLRQSGKQRESRPVRPQYYRMAGQQ